MATPLEPKYKIHQELKETLGFGDCTITDVFYSPNSNIFVYEVKDVELDQLYLAREEDLQPYKEDGDYET